MNKLQRQSTARKTTLFARIKRKSYPYYGKTLISRYTSYFRPHWQLLMGVFFTSKLSNSALQRIKYLSIIFIGVMKCKGS